MHWDELKLREYAATCQQLDHELSALLGRSVYEVSYCRSNAECFALTIAHELAVDHYRSAIWVGESDDPYFQYESVDDHPDSTAAARVAIVKAVIHVLKNPRTLIFDSCVFRRQRLQNLEGN